LELAKLTYTIFGRCILEALIEFIFKFEIVIERNDAVEFVRLGLRITQSVTLNQVSHEFAPWGSTIILNYPVDKPSHDVVTHKFSFA
jgi:hypothetical protein